MGLRSITLALTLPADATPLVDAVPRFLAASATTWFRVRAIRGGDGARAWALGDDGAWTGEVRAPDDAMSTLAGDDDGAIARALPARLAELDGGGERELVMTGATATARDHAPWHARLWPEAGGAIEAVRVRLVATPRDVNLWIEWPLWGYPLSAIALTAAGATAGDPLHARACRARILPAVAAAVAAFGAPASAASWSFDVTLGTDQRWFGGVELGAILDGSWLPALHAGQADTVSEPIVADDAPAIVAALAGTLDQGVPMLNALLRAPNPDPRIVAAVAALTEDARPAILQVPYRIGPIKLLAELVAARLRAARGEDPRAYVWSTPPLTATELEARERAGALPPLALTWSPDDPHALTLARYQRLCDAGLLDEQGYAIDHRQVVSDLAPPEDEVPAPVSAPAIAAPPPDEAELVADLDGGGDRRAWALEDLLTEPSSSPAVAAAIARALDDRTPCGIAGALVGEIRLLAAAALAAARFRSADLTPVDATFTMPLSTAELLDARAAHPDAPSADDYDERLRLFAWLRDHVGLPEVRRSLRHPIDLLGLVAPR